MENADPASRCPRPAARRFAVRVRVWLQYMGRPSHMLSTDCSGPASFRRRSAGHAGQVPTNNE